MRVLLLLLGALVAGAAAWSEGKVRVGVYSLDFPYCYVGEDGEITGDWPVFAAATARGRLPPPPTGHIGRPRAGRVHAAAAAAARCRPRWPCSPTGQGARR